MANKNEQYLKPLRELCKKLDLRDSVERLKEYILKDKFYECNVSGLLIEVLESKQDHASERAVAAVFELFQLILRRGTFLKTVLVHLYNYSLREKKIRRSVADEFYKVCLLENLTDSAENAEICLLYNDRVCTIDSIGGNKSKRDVVYANMRDAMKEMKNDDGLHQKLFRVFNQRIQNYAHEDKNLVRAYDFVEEVVIKGLEGSDVKSSSGAVFQLYFNILTFIFNWPNNENHDTNGKLVKAMKKVLLNEEQLTCNNIIYECIQLMASSCVDAKELKEFYRKFYKNSTAAGENEWQQKTTLMIMKVLFLKPEKFKLSIECYTVFHEVVYSFLHILKDIKSEPGVIKCCSDIKRHEIFNLTHASIKYLIELVSSENVSPSYARHVDFYMKYALQICNELKCDSKDKYRGLLIHILYSFLHKFYANTSTVRPNLKTIDNICKQVFQLMEMDIKSFDLKSFRSNMSIVTSTIYEHLLDDTDKTVARSVAVGLSYNFVMQKQQLSEASDQKTAIHQKMIWKALFGLRKVAKTLGFSSATSLLEKCLKGKELAEFSKGISLKGVCVQELISLSRYEPRDVDERCMLFKKICADPGDMSSFALACNVIREDILKSVDRRMFEDLNARLEKHAPQTSEESIVKLIALINNHYYLYLIDGNELSATLKESYVDKKIPECHNLDAELKLLNYLNKSLHHCAELQSLFEKNTKNIDHIQSKTRFFAVMENVANNFCLRGIEYKDIEAKSFLWKFLQYDAQQHQEKILDTSSYFLDHFGKLTDKSGNYIRTSKHVSPVKMEQILAESSKAADALIEKFQDLSVFTQFRVLNYLLSLWHYFMMTKRRDDGQNAWEKFDKLRATSKISDDSCLHHLTRAKMMFAFADLSFHVCKRNAFALLNEAVFTIHLITTYDAEIGNIYWHNVTNILNKAFLYSANRLLDMDHYISSVSFLKSRSISKGHFFKTLEYSSLHILWKLNMEKIEDGKNELAVVAKLLQIKEEIVVAIPEKLQQLGEIQNFGMVTPARRDASQFPTPRIMSISDSSEEDDQNVVQQLLQLIHEKSCKCTMCQYPVLKCYLFQLGCYYARLYWLMGKYDISKQFCENALEPWRYFCGKTQRSSSKCAEFLSVNKMDFIIASIRWLFQVADTFVKTRDYEEAEEVYAEIDLLCTNNIPDYECIKQNLYGRKENLEQLMKLENASEPEKSGNELSFEEFCRIKGIKPKTSDEQFKIKSQPTTKKPTHETKKITKDLAKKLSPPSSASSSSSSTQLPKKPTPDSVIYIDSDESFQREEPPKIRRKEKVKTPATRVAKKASSEKADKTVTVDLMKESTPVARVRRRMI